MSPLHWSGVKNAFAIKLHPFPIFSSSVSDITSCHLPRLQLPWGGRWPRDVGGHTSPASWNWNWALVRSCLLFHCPDGLSFSRDQLLGASRKHSVYCANCVQCGKLISLEPVLSFPCAGAFFFHGGDIHSIWNSPFYTVISWHLAHPIMAQSPPVFSFRIFP